MKPLEKRELKARFRAQHGLIRRDEARVLGVTAKQERLWMAGGDWERFGHRAIRLAGTTRTPEQDLLAACMNGGPTAVASHQSAAWLWGIWPVPDRHAITIARGGAARPAGVDVHRPVDYPERVVTRRAILCTNPLRTLVDLAAVSTEDELDGAVDQALARRLLTVGAIEAEVDRLGRPGRSGAGLMRRALQRRGLTGALHPSVLESRTLRLLRQFGIEPLGTEVRMGPDGRYRVDIVLASDVIMEVDGFAYHFDPEQMAEDKRRRTQIRQGGTTVLEYTWRDIVHEPGRVISEVRRALARSAAAGADNRPAIPRS
jgi:hypothetical protein